MRVTAIFSAVVLLLSDIATAKQIYHRPRGTRWRRDLDDGMVKAAYEMIEGRLERRQTSSSSITPTSNADMNATIAEACLDGLSGISSVLNQAGVTACYNILSHDIQQGTFQADLRLYAAGEATGPFAGIEASNMMIGLTYPPSTTFESLMKRSIRKRQTSNMSEMQQYTLNGFFTKTLDLSKLNQTELMSLMVPEITLNGVNPADTTPIVANISSTDMVYFVVFDFQGAFSPDVVTSKLQTAAIAASSKFVLPGTTFGMFPTGFIVTSVWMVLFLIAYGVGTLGRLRHRKVFRARKAAVGGRVGKRFGVRG